MAQDPGPKIRESVASSHNAPADVMSALARAAEEARAPGSPAMSARPVDLLRFLCLDASETVGGWVAVNARTPDDALHGLDLDNSQFVHRLLEWKAEFLRV